MKLIINDPTKAHLLSIILKNLRLFVDTISFRFKEDELHIQTLDCGQCCLLDLHISSNWFDSYNCTLDSCESSVIAVNTNTLQKAWIQEQIRNLLNFQFKIGLFVYYIIRI